MAYSPTYESTDLGSIILDFFGSIGVFIVGFAAIIGIILAVRYLTGKKLVK